MLTKFLAFCGLSSFAKAKPLAVGRMAPDLIAINQDGLSVSLKEAYAKGVVLVYFYPKADTPGCTKEACSIRDGWGELRAQGVQVIGVSGDTVEAQKKFADKYKLPHPLLADTTGAVAKAFGVPTFLGLPKRQSFLIQDGKCVWNQLSASTGHQADDVLKAMSVLRNDK